MTYLELITNAYRLRNVIDENETPSAEQGVAALTILNNMMAEWESEGVCLQYIPVAASELAQDLTLPAYSLGGVTASLAVRLVSGGAPTAELQQQLEDGYGAIVRRAVQDGLPAQSMDHLPVGSGDRRFARQW